MKKKFYPLISQAEAEKISIEPFKIGELRLLLVNKDGNFFLLENKCGHFGAPMDNARLVDETIVCVHHGISFDLHSGKVANRPWETCDPIQTFEVCIRDNILGFELNDDSG